MSKPLQEEALVALAKRFRQKAGITRAQAARAGLSGSQRETTSWSMLPAADIEAIVVLRIWDSWGMSVSGGPTLHWLDGGTRTGWSSGLGVTWQH